MFEKERSKENDKKTAEILFYNLDPKYIRVVNPFYFRKKLGISFKTKKRNGAVYYYTANNWLVHNFVELLYFIWGKLYTIFYALFINSVIIDEDGNPVKNQIYESFKLMNEMTEGSFSRRFCIVGIDVDKIDFIYFENRLTERYKRRYGVTLESRIYEGLEL